ncbi:PadR family transcriptional regulator [Pseudonocardia sp. NPDC049635]|uniref:PadR family transcriptional regulator n=1 Tax=Pseudonocardia sp. NPDC049635 TaxID=3155506 RepID=UPI00340ED122
MHGHRLRFEGVARHVHLWTEVSVGALYGAVNRLAAEGLLRNFGQEIVGNRPMRRVYEIPEKGRRALAELRAEGLAEVWFRYDPFDLALARIDETNRRTLPTVLAERIQLPQKMLDRAVLQRCPDGTERFPRPSGGPFGTPSTACEPRSSTSPT